MFNRVETLTPEAHAELRFQPARSYDAARDVQTAPLAMSEIIEAAKHFPIVFPIEGEPGPQTLLGLSENHNAFVAEDGRWTAPYVPAHFRRYPFILQTTREADSFVLAIDRDAPHFAAQTGTPLFDEAGNISDVTRQARDFLSSFHKELRATRKAFAPLREAGVLVPKQIAFGPEGERRSVGGFAAVDPEALAKVDDETFLQWRRAEILPLIYAAAASLSNARRLAPGSDRADSREAGEGPSLTDEPQGRA